MHLWSQRCRYSRNSGLDRFCYFLKTFEVRIFLKAYFFQFPPLKNKNPGKSLQIYDFLKICFLSTSLFATQKNPKKETNNWQIINKHRITSLIYVTDWNNLPISFLFTGFYPTNDTNAHVYVCWKNSKHQSCYLQISVSKCQPKCVNKHTGWTKTNLIKVFYFANFRISV